MARSNHLGAFIPSFREVIHATQLKNRSLWTFSFLCRSISRKLYPTEVIMNYNLDTWDEVKEAYENLKDLDLVRTYLSRFGNLPIEVRDVLETHLTEDHLQGEPHAHMV